MGKKSKSTKIMKAAPLKVPKTFDCPFCSHAQTIEVKLYALLSLYDSLVNALRRKPC